MGILYGKPGKVIYVKPKQGWFHKREKFLRPGEHLEYFGKAPGYSEISEGIINITIEEENFKTGDQAILKWLKICLSMKADINADDERLRNSMFVFENGRPDIWLQNRLANQLLSKLNDYPLSAILHDVDTKDCGKEKIRGSVNTPGKLSKTLESWIQMETEDTGFVILENSFRILCSELPPREELDPANPNHQSMIAYISGYESRKNDLLKKERAYKKKEHAHNQAIKEMEYAYRQAVKNREHDYKQAIQEMEYAHEQTIQEMSAAYKQAIREKEYGYEQTIQDLKAGYKQMLREKERAHELAAEEMAAAYELAAKKAELDKAKELYELEIKKENEKAKSEELLTHALGEMKSVKIKRMEMQWEAEHVQFSQKTNTPGLTEGERKVRTIEKNDPINFNYPVEMSRVNLEKKQIEMSSCHGTRNTRKSLLPTIFFPVSLIFLIPFYLCTACIWPENLRRPRRGPFLSAKAERIERLTKCLTAD